MQIKTIENSPEEDVAIIMSSKELHSVMKCIGVMSINDYQKKGAPSENTDVIQPFYDTMEEYLYTD